MLVALIDRASAAIARQRGRCRRRDRGAAPRRRPRDLDRRHEPGVRAVPRSVDTRCCAPATPTTRAARARRVHRPRDARRGLHRDRRPRAVLARSCARRRRWSTTPATRTARCGSPRPRCSTPSACGSRLGAARVQQLLAQLCDKAGLGGKAERYRQAAINEMRNLGDRRATAELLLNDTPTRSAVVMPEPARRRDAADQGDRLGRGPRAREAQVEPAANIENR